MVDRQVCDVIGQKCDITHSFVGRIEKSPSIWLEGMEGSVLGIWSAHGEGRVYFPDAPLAQHIENHNLIPIRYVAAYGVLEWLE